MQGLIGGVPFNSGVPTPSGLAITKLVLFEILQEDLYKIANVSAPLPDSLLEGPAPGTEHSIANDEKRLFTPKGFRNT